jgi:hypothetical protein
MKYIYMAVVVLLVGGPVAAVYVNLPPSFSFGEKTAAASLVVAMLSLLMGAYCVIFGEQLRRLVDGGLSSSRKNVVAATKRNARPRALAALLLFFCLVAAGVVATMISPGLMTTVPPPQRDGAKERPAGSHARASGERSASPPEHSSGKAQEPVEEPIIKLRRDVDAHLKAGRWTRAYSASKQLLAMTAGSVDDLRAISQACLQIFASNEERNIATDPAILEDGVKYSTQYLARLPRGAVSEQARVNTEKAVLILQQARKTSR